MHKIVLSTLFSLSFLFFSLTAREPYRATLIVAGDSAQVNESNLVNLRRSLSSSSIQALIPLYTPVSAVSIGINLRGIRALTSFAANSTDLVVVIPQTGAVEVFSGGSRDASISLFKDYIHDAGRNSNLLRAYAKYSPIDPVAGNPNSLLASMGQADYLTGRLSPLAGCDSCWSAQPIVHQFQAGLNGNRSFSGGFDTTTVSLPLRYSYSPNLDWALIIDAPLTYYRNGGASSLYTSLGIGFRYPVCKEWALTALTRFGSGGSLDLCTSGSFLTAGLLSVYDLNFWKMNVALINYAGYYTTTNLWLTGINFNYHLQNYVFKNGVTLTSCEGYCLFDRSIHLTASFTDTYYPSHRLYIRHYDEVGVGLVVRGVNGCLDYDCLTVGFAYQYGHRDYRGYGLNMVYQF